jgi:hypothetical protein
VIGATATASAALGQLLGREILGVELREQRLVASGAARRVEIALLDAAEPVEHIERPAAQLAELAVADDVDAGLCLLADDLRDLLMQAGVERAWSTADAVLDRSTYSSPGAGAPGFPHGWSGCGRDMDSSHDLLTTRW